MLLVSSLDVHQSSPMKIYKDLTSLAKRTDLYTGDDFYFGFDSSNHSFLDIIGGHQPLAIKHGPILSLYQHNIDGYNYAAYYIDAKNKTLVPVINITAKPVESAAFQRLLPWSFTDFYLQTVESSAVSVEVPATAVDSTITPEEKAVQQGLVVHENMIRNVLEQLATSLWPDDRTVKFLPDAISDLNSRTKNLAITLDDLSVLKKSAVKVVKKGPGSDDFIAPYNPFYDNERISIDFLTSVHPELITVRKINGTYPRIEIIVPGLPDGKHYSAVYEHEAPRTYNNLKESLDNPQALADLLKDNFPELLGNYLPSKPSASSAL